MSNSPHLLFAVHHGWSRLLDQFTVERKVISGDFKDLATETDNKISNWLYKFS